MSKQDKRDRDMSEETKEEEREAENDGDSDTPEPAGERKRGGGMHSKHHEKRKRGGGLDAAKEHKVNLAHHHARKRGGHVPGHMAKERPDRRARGGGMSDTNPYTSAGKVSVPDYEHAYKDSNAPVPKGEGADKMPYGKRRPG